MSKNLTKLQIRAEILNAVKILDSGEKHTESFLNSVIKPLLEIEDKNSILDILIKEIIANPEFNRFLILSFLIENLIPKEMLESELWKLLNMPHINDTAKANIINILKDLGNRINYEKYTEYFENPDSVIDADTEKMLQSAISNPEALIDFLDFIEALPEQDRSLLIDSLCDDYQGDELANLFAPVLYANPNSTLVEYAISRLGDSKSALALNPLNFILEYTKNPQIAAAAKKSLTALKLAGIKEDNSKTYYTEVFKDSKIDDVYISMPDGHGTVGILASRKRNGKDSLQMFAVVFNDAAGILDCFGFNDITTIEFNRIVNKFYFNQERIYITPSTAKVLLNNAEKKTLQRFGRISYEYVCWKRILCDAPDLQKAEEEIFSEKLEKIDVTTNDLKSLYQTTAIFDKWFFFTTGNNAYNELINQIVEGIKGVCEAQKAFEIISELTENKIKEIWTIEEVERINYRLLFSAYLLRLNGFKNQANTLYSIITTDEVKDELLNNIVKLSIYEFMLREKSKYQNASISTNIFSRRNEANKTLIEKNLLNGLLKEIERNWST